MFLARSVHAAVYVLVAAGEHSLRGFTNVRHSGSAAHKLRRRLTLVQQMPQLWHTCVQLIHTKPAPTAQVRDQSDVGRVREGAGGYGGRRCGGRSGGRRR
jgi:hypothetical protein